ncbi:MAG: hypothetical protein Kow0029_31130 [Candidatus Rifleibacteriota bacterium]
MPINELEIAGSSISFKCWTADIENASDVFKRIMQEGDQLDIESETPGFHDCDCDSKIIRGYYSGIVPFEVEHLVEGNTTRTLLKRIESCEFIATSRSVFTMGKPGPTKGLAMALSAIIGSEVSLMEFEFSQLSQLQERMAKIKSIVVTNPKEKEIRRARLAGHIESYTEYNIIDPRNHGIDSISGVVTTPLGSMTVTVSKKGGLRLGVQKGLIINVECLEWLLDLIREEKRPDPIENFNSSL